MRIRPFFAVALVLMLFLAQGCALFTAATPPQPNSPEQSWILATHESKAFVAAANDSFEQGLISSTAHATVLDKSIEARDMLARGSSFLAVGDLTGAAEQLNLATLVLLQARSLLTGPSTDGGYSQ